MLSWANAVLYILPFEWKGPNIHGKNPFEVLDDVVVPLVIGGIGFVKICLAKKYWFRRKLPRFPGLRRWLASNHVNFGTAVDVLVSVGSLLRINLSYLYLAIPFTAVFLTYVLYMRSSQVSGQEEHPDQAEMINNPETCLDVESGSSRTGIGTDDSKKKVMLYPELVVLMAPHLMLSVSGVVGDPDHDGNNYDISILFLFLTCMLQELTLIMFSRGIAQASDLLYKASLVVLLLTAHILAVNTFGEKVVLLLLPEVVAPLIWISLHLDRRTPIINVQRIASSEHMFFKAVVVAICGCILRADEYLLNWASTSCAASGLITYVIVHVLRLWPLKLKAGFATLSSVEVLELLTFWWKLLFQVAVLLLVFGGAAQVYRSS